ncbi:MAG: glycosyltransferase [Marinobacter sp.]|uniref:glycosyltransferase n=1 Tax=Marinobacter sp. TaxID=50741 RepID=UPI00396EF68A
MDISVVLATYNRDEILAKTLLNFQSLKTDGLAWQVFVVDNACRPETLKLVSGFSESLPVRYLEEVTAGKNNALLRAMPEVEGQLVVFTDDDVIADPDWLLNLWSGAKRLPQFDLFGGRILPLFPEGMEPEEGIDLENGFTRSAYVIADWDLPEGEIRPGRIWGPNMAVRKRVFDAGYSFDPSIGPSQSASYTMGSETEFLLRVSEAGFRGAYIPTALVHHQIRPNQLSIDWLRGRAYRQGKGKAALYGEFDGYKHWFGVPRFLFRKLVTLFTKTQLCKLLGDSSRYYRNAIELGMFQGIFAYYREKNRPKDLR